MCDARLLLDAFQHIHASFSSELEVEQNQGRLLVLHMFMQVGHGRLAPFHNIQPPLVAGLRKGLAKQFAFAGAVVDKEDGA